MLFFSIFSWLILSYIHKIFTMLSSNFFWVSDSSITNFKLVNYQFFILYFPWLLFYYLPSFSYIIFVFF